MIAVYRASGEAEAQIILGLLTSHQIPAMLKSNAAPSVHVFAIDGMGEVQVMVREALADKAKKLIQREEHV